MKTNILKRLLSLILALICIVGTATASITSISATESDVSQTGVASNEAPIKNEYKIVSPVPIGSSIEDITQPSRLNGESALKGATIALVGGSFSASVTHRVLADMLVEEYGCKIYFMDEIGKGGTFNPLNPSDKSKEFQRKLQDYGVDAVISGNCGCGICTVKETGNALAAEYIGIPAVVVGAETFIPQIESTGFNRGVPVVRTAAYPGAFANDETAVQQQKARDILYSQVVKGLTTQITQAEIDRIAGEAGSASYDDVIFTGSYQRVQEFYEVSEMSDGLPVVPPTQEKIEYYLQFTNMAATDIVNEKNGEIIGVKPAYKTITAYQVAVNAIMSGCPAEYMPICMAITRCFANGNFYKSLDSTHGWTPYVLVSGPIARQLGIDNAQGMTTEECNIAIARFMELALINLAGLERTNAFGNVQPLVFSEDEQNCVNVGWEPHHVQKGYNINQNVITATSFSMWGNNITPATDLPEEIMKVMAWDITEKNLGGLGYKSTQDNANAKRTILITPSVAQALAKKYKSKDALENALVTNARRPLWMRTYAYYYANTGGALSKSFSDVYDELKKNSLEDAKTTASPSWMNGITYAEIDTVATMTKGNTDIIIQGDESRNKTQVMPGGVSVCKEIKLDENTWDDLLASMVVSIVYKPLSDHYVTAVDNTVNLPTASEIPTELQVTKQTTYTVAASATYAKSKNRIFYDAPTSTLYYGDGTTAHTVVLDTDKYADFITLVETIGRNGTIKLNNKNTITAVSVAFKTNKNFPDQNIVDYTDSTFKTVPLTIQAVSSTQSSSIDGAYITMSADITTFTAYLGGDIVMGDSTDADFVKVNGTTVTVDSTAKVGATAVVGVSDGNGTYKTMTFVNSGDGSYKITYNTGNTLTLSASSYYLKGTFNNWEATDAFSKTDNDDIVTVIKDIPAGTYTFKVHNAGADEWHGNAGTISDTANRWTMDSSTDCTFKATGGTYEFKYEISTNKLSVYLAQTGATPAPTTKTVYVGVIEYITDFVPTLHYWNNSTGLAGDATLTATGETQQYAVGSAYWNNTKQNFKIYKAEVPTAANGMKTFRKSNNDRWAAEDIAYAENKIILLFEWGGTYHNTTGSYTPVVPTEPPTTSPTNPPTEAPTEPEKLLGDVDYDGLVTIMDATLIQMSLAQITKLTDEQVKIADTSKDTVVSIMDATLIQMFVAQLITKF